MLVVEDQASQAQSLQASLGDRGFAVTTANTASQALVACAQETFDAVVLDVVLPDVDGVVVCRQLRSMRSFRKYSFLGTVFSPDLPR